ncbi:ribonucleases P/MRP protein subunit POP1-domain-containing protein [Melanogaster broomeanus]|nr:ribonucleases P/MRP protein subunit POP1-domain-containing protein [Melanogaster broomeanus]
MQGLPASIDVERFTEARSFEIDAMQKAIKAAGDSSTHRAWQTLPRHLRRRAASHDVRRVPVRLREKARAEVSDKTWLETHIWHAKRAKMENMWGYRLAVTPTEKAFRPSHRASVHGSILHDASYYATIELKGPQALLQAALEKCCDPLASGMKRCMTGGRACETHIYKHGSYPFDLIGPIAIIWQPLSPEPKSSSAPTAPIRIIWVRAHPAVFEDVFEALRLSVSHTLQESKEKDPEAHAEIEIADLRGSINAFEIMGPKSSQVIKGALSPAGGEDRVDFKKFWESLNDLQTPSTIPRGMVIGFKVLDPRLKFPPKNAKPHYPDLTQPSNHSPPAFIFPTALIAQSEIWDEGKRGGLKKPKYKKKEIDERRSKNLIPGTPLNPLRQDDRIPVLLIQRSLESCPPSSASTSTSTNTHGIHGWTLLFPAGWSMPFLSSLIYTGTRFAGQRERAKQFFEAGVPGFPMDYPTIPAYHVATSERAEKEAGKKPNYEKLGTRSPWCADWDVVLGLQTLPASSSGEGEEGLVTTQREDPPRSDSMEVDILSSAPRPWLLRGAKLWMASLRADDMMKSGLVMVRAKMVTRGAPTDLANIYRMNDIEARKWLRAFSTQGHAKLADADEPNEQVVCYVTSGDASLLRGEGFAIGAISVMEYLALRKQAQRLTRPSVLVKIRDRDATTCRVAYLELLDA